MERYEFTREQRELMEAMQVPFAIYQFVGKRVVTLILSDGFCKMCGYTSREQAYHDMDHNMYEGTHPDDVARVANAAFRFATEGGSYEVVYRARRQGSLDYRILHSRGEHIVTDTGVTLAQVWYTDEGLYVKDGTPEVIEITRTLSRALYDQSVTKQNQYDYLTGLPSMSYFFELVNAEKDAIEERGGRPVILYIDFSGMKFFNSKYGFEQGDKILQAFAGILSATFSNENCCRIGADHFAVITELAGLEDRLKMIFAQFGALNDGQTPPVNVGIYPRRPEDKSVSLALDRAKYACMEKSGSYSSGFSYYTAEMSERASRRQYIKENIDKAIRNKWIKVYYQPIVRSVNEKICDEEALARWIDPEKGFMSPADFIPALEEAGLIYKLDLFVLDQVLEDMQAMKAEGLYIVPHSINLSRSDFDTCDIVEEIRRRVDDSGFSRDKITIEITESMIGSDFEFMKKQIERFQALGFPVWMDDFGSGYSTLDVLQSVRFDMVKFDMSFMRKLDEGESGKIVLTEMMKMVTALRIGTLCEGVETEEQVRFLREIGCTRMQGYYYSKPTPFEKKLAWYKENKAENPEEADYFESIGRVNFYDLDFIAQGDENSFMQSFDMLPMGIVEVKGDEARYVRSNQPFRDFVRRFIGLDISAIGSKYGNYDAPYMHYVLQKCCEEGGHSIYDDMMPDGTVVHSFARNISTDPVTGNTAIAIAVISVKEPDGSTTYEDIARALAADYHKIYVVDMENDDYMEYTTLEDRREMAQERHGEDFFDYLHKRAMEHIYKDDKERILPRLTKENIIHELDEYGFFNAVFRRVEGGEPVYVNMKISRTRANGKSIIVGISQVDAFMKAKERFESMRKERDSMVRIMALSDGYIGMYTVDPRTGHYVEYSATKDFESLGAAKEGDNFFAQAVIEANKLLHPDDRQRFVTACTAENVMREIKEKGTFRIRYRLMLHGKPVPTILKAAMFSEGDEEMMAIGIRRE